MPRVFEEHTDHQGLVRVWINRSAFEQSNLHRPVAELGQEWIDAMRAASEGRLADLPDWMAAGTDGGSR